MSDLHRFMGGSPGSVLVKLIFLSLLVGAFLAFLDLTPFGLFDTVVQWIQSVFDLSFDTLKEIGRWIFYGAVIVVPVWLVSRLIARR